jgi:hypothetical protein
LPIRHIGGRIVVASEDLRQWLVAMGGLPAADPATAPQPAPADPAPRRRPGRPRRSATGAGQ